MAYHVRYSETAEAEIEQAYLWISQRSPEVAARWYAGLLEAVDSLADMPRRFSVMPEYGEGVRRMLYGTGQLRYRVLYLIVEPDEREEEGTVRILHVHHGARRLPGEQHEGSDEQVDAL
jgi:plasmid stabilization system protein ParE